jgi:hypothetical protein
LSTISHGALYIYAVCLPTCYDNALHQGGFTPVILAGVTAYTILYTKAAIDVLSFRA